MTTAPSPHSFRAAYTRLQLAQKDSRGAPPYSRFVNRPLGRVFAAAAYRLGVTPDQVTLVSGSFTFAGILVVAAGPADRWTGVVVAVLLVLGYALDAADGQLARLRGGGSAVGEWLDHMIDSGKLATIHLAVLIAMFRHFDVRTGWLLVPIAYTAVQTVHFFGMLLTDLLLRERHARTAAEVRYVAPRVDIGRPTLLTLGRLPVDYGLLCVIFVTLGWHPVFLALYGLTGLAWAGYLVLAVVRWRRLLLPPAGPAEPTARPAEPTAGPVAP